MNRKISTIVDAKVWQELQQHAKETHQNLSGIVTEALRDYLKRRRVRPTFVKHMEDSLQEHEPLGRLLAR